MTRRPLQRATGKLPIDTPLVVSALYVDLRKNGTDWHRPLDVTSEEAYQQVNDAIRDYAGERDRLMNTAQHAAEAQRVSELRLAEMHEANVQGANPVELPVVVWG